ncbi:unnamed protein product, partial [Darwinula stevensoni]
GQALFRAFLQREYSEENIEFWLAVEDYRKTRSSKQQVKARKIYNDYIATRAPKENVDACGPPVDEPPSPIDEPPSPTHHRASLPRSLGVLGVASSHFSSVIRCSLTGILGMHRLPSSSPGTNDAVSPRGKGDRG